MSKKKESFSLIISRGGKEERQVEQVKLLLAGGADPNELNINGQSPVKLAIIFKKPLIEKVLVKAGGMEYPSGTKTKARDTNDALKGKREVNNNSTTELVIEKSSKQKNKIAETARAKSTNLDTTRKHQSEDKINLDFDGSGAEKIVKKHRVWSVLKNNPRDFRGGPERDSFVYLLIDPKVLSKNNFSTFVKAIFYVGKGKNQRQFDHLFEALDTYMNEGGSKPSSTSRVTRSKTEGKEKIARITSIWISNRGVICLKVFPDITQAEAFTREAAIIDTLGVSNLTNILRGSYYGPAADLTDRDRRIIGDYLLHKSMQTFYSKRQEEIRPDDLVFYTEQYGIKRRNV